MLSFHQMRLVVVASLFAVIMIGCNASSKEKEHKVVFSSDKYVSTADSNPARDYCKKKCAEQYGTNVNTLLTSGWKIVNKESKTAAPMPKDPSVLSKPISSMNFTELNEYEAATTCSCVGTEYVLEK